jgi:hypothetical protein
LFILADAARVVHSLSNASLLKHRKMTVKNCQVVDGNHKLHFSTLPDCRGSKTFRPIRRPRREPRVRLIIRAWQGLVDMRIDLTGNAA